MAGKELTASVSIIINGTAKQFESIDNEEKDIALRSMQNRLSDSMSLYFTNNLKEAKQLFTGG